MSINRLRHALASGRGRFETQTTRNRGEQPVIQYRRDLRFAIYFVALAVTALLGVTARGSAQVVGATMSGTVSDTSGGVVPDANISVKNVATGIIRMAVTNGSGLFTVPNLQPGPYEITTSASGFNTDVRRGITLNVRQE